MKVIPFVSRKTYALHDENLISETTNSPYWTWQYRLYIIGKTFSANGVREYYILRGISRYCLFLTSPLRYKNFNSSISLFSLMPRMACFEFSVTDYPSVDRKNNKHGSFSVKKSHWLLLKIFRMRPLKNKAME